MSNSSSQNEDDSTKFNEGQNTDLKLTEVMDYIRGDEVDPAKIRHYQSLLANFRPNFMGFMAITTYKQMQRLSRLLDRLDEIEEYLFMDRESVFYTSRMGSNVSGASSISEAMEIERAQRANGEESGQGGNMGRRSGSGVGSSRSNVSSQKGVSSYSERNERELIALAERISTKVQETLSYLVTLLDKISKKSLPDGVDDMIRSQAVLPEGGNPSKVLDKSSRDNVRKLISQLQKNIQTEEVD